MFSLFELIVSILNPLREGGKWCGWGSMTIYYFLKFWKESLNADKKSCQLFGCGGGAAPTEMFPLRLSS